MCEFIAHVMADLYNYKCNQCIAWRQKFSLLIKVGDARTRNLRKFPDKFLHLCVDKQYPNNMTSSFKNRNLRENLRKFIVRESPV